MNDFVVELDEALFYGGVNGGRAGKSEGRVCEGGLIGFVKFPGDEGN